MTSTVMHIFICNFKLLLEIDSISTSTLTKDLFKIPLSEDEKNAAIQSTVSKTYLHQSLLTEELSESCVLLQTSMFTSVQRNAEAD